MEHFEFIDCKARYTVLYDDARVIDEDIPVKFHVYHNDLGFWFKCEEVIDSCSTIESQFANIFYDITKIGSNIEDKYVTAKFRKIRGY